MKKFNVFDIYTALLLIYLCYFFYWVFTHPFGFFSIMILASVIFIFSFSWFRDNKF